MLYTIQWQTVCDSMLTRMILYYLGLICCGETLLFFLSCYKQLRRLYRQTQTALQTLFKHLDFVTNRDMSCFVLTTCLN